MSAIAPCYIDDEHVEQLITMLNEAGVGVVLNEIADYCNNMMDETKNVDWDILAMRLQAISEAYADLNPQSWHDLQAGKDIAK
jgi:hypothetical protein